MIDIVKVKVNGGTELKDVVDVRVEAAMSATATCDITVAASRTGDVVPKMLPDGVSVGAEVEVTGGDSEVVLDSVFKGIVTAISWEIDAEMGEFVVIRALDPSFKLWLGSPRRALLKQKFGDVISKMAGEVGLSADVTLSGDTTVFDYQLQTSSRGELLRAIMASTGGYWVVKDGKLVVRDAGASPAVTVTSKYGDDLVRLRARVTATGGAKKVSVRGWDPTTTKEVVGQDTGKDILLDSGLSTHLSKADTLGSDAGVLTSHRVVVDKTQADVVAKSLRRRAKAEQLQVRLERRASNHLGDLRPGAAVQLDGVGSELAGKYRVAAVTHIWSRFGWRSIITTGTPEPPTLAELTAADGARVASWGKQAPVIGIVTNNQPDEAKHSGMVKVKFVTVDDQVESTWARVLAVGAGKQRGLLAIPEVDDEVLVMFEQGDTARPVVLGGLWSQKNPTPVEHTKYVKSGKVQQWTLTARPGQHITVMEGEGDKENYVVVAMPGDKIKLHVGKDKVELWSDDKTLEVKAGTASVLLDGKGAMTLKADKIEIKADQDVTIQGMNVNIKGQQSAKVEGAMLDLKASGQGKLDGGGQLALKGGMVNIN